MTVICAWCQKQMPDAPGPAGPLVSHGMCPDCLKTFEAPAIARKGQAA